MVKKKAALIKIGGIIFVVIIAAFIYSLSIRSEFTKYLDTKYPKLSFKVGLTKNNILYGNYYSDVTCLNDGTYFVISKDKENISEDYIQYKSVMQYNSKIKSAFKGRAIQKHIKSVTGSGAIPFKNNASYIQINIDLINGVDQISDAKDVLKILKEKNIVTNSVIFSYEKDKSYYELWLPSNGYNLTRKQIESKIIKIR
ncbi:hypothetical protein LL037_08095 [Clostridium estertheticum]|uniref:hypothetical protein n=1 Tax=Clostridium estertheticum TaxID=238834 RepID=UPI001C0E3B07|nr:hypothetical protein [Clostridium estertheticum]MBU3199819.1 hypothetical protein [Clostridium estertheticum]WAG67080.1 hypothetical protein LL037_08095 [Clostridium estertheticum]